jgi:hypothetical protein
MLALLQLPIVVSFIYLSQNHFYEVCKKIQKREMENHTYGEVFEREAPRAARP